MYYFLKLCPCVNTYLLEYLVGGCWMYDDALYRMATKDKSHLKVYSKDLVLAIHQILNIYRNLVNKRRSQNSSLAVLVAA